jgi:hypothetical protein
MSLTRKKVGIGFGAAALLFFILTGVTAPPQQKSNITEKTDANKISAIDSNLDQQAPVITTKTITETEAVSFESRTVESPSLDKGATTVTTQGVDGVKTRTFEVAFEDGKETKRTFVKEEVTTQPIAQITTIGTKVLAPKPASSCNPNYSGACVPIASDVDCAGGSGNGPAYVGGPVTVIGTDPYGLDADHDGIGCE